MEAILYVPYIPYKENFDYGTNIDPTTYAHMLENDYLNSNQMVNGYMNKRNKNLMYQYNSQEKKHSQYQNEGGIAFYDVPIKLYDMNNNDESVVNLIEYYEKEEMFINIIELIHNKENVIKNNKFEYTTKDDAESELYFWVKDSMKINKNPKISGDAKLKMLPYKNMKLGLGKNSMANIEGCKVVQQYSPTKFAVLINKIIF